MPPLLVVDLADAAALNTVVVGGKGANLARLVDAGFRAPGGFCVTTAAYRLLTDDDAVRDSIQALTTLGSEDSEAIAAQSAQVRDEIRNRPLPDGVRQDVETALAEFDGAAYAVRSSATAEDLPTASFAGQHETYLGVSEAEVLARVRDCMASLFTERAVTYRLKNRIPQTTVALAVVVQEMVDPEAAGVLFTADPVTGNRTVASIDASFGLGDALVAGAVTTDNARVDRTSGELLEYTVGEKPVATRLRTEAESGTETIELPKERRRERALSDAQVRELVTLGNRVTALFEEPQDIEWALVEGEFVLLQARPITSLFPLPDPQPDDDRLHVYLSFSHAQAMPEAMPPLVVDLWRDFLNNGLRRISSEACADRLAVSAGGRIYLDLTPLLESQSIRNRLPNRVESVSEPAAGGLRALLADRADEFDSDDPLATTRAVLAVFRRTGYSLAPSVLRILGRFVSAFLFGPPSPRKERQWVEEWGKDLATAVREPADPARQANAVFDRYDFSTVLSGILPRIGPLLLAGVVAGKTLRWFFPNAGGDIDAIGKGFEMEIVTRMNLRLGDLTDIAREQPAVAAALRQGASRKDLEGVDGGEEFLDGLDDFLDEFGHRATGEIDISRPRWRDDPSGLLQSVRSSLQHGERGAQRDHLRRLEDAADGAAMRLEQRAASGVLGPLRRPVVRALIRTYRGGVQLREYPKQGLGHLFAAWHENIAALGTSLVADGRLERPDHIWYLHRDELFDALERDTSLAVDLDARQREHEHVASMRAPPIYTTEGEDPTTLVRRTVQPGILTGTPVSTGIVEGTARVVSDPAAITLERGDIIVAPSCDPGWTPLFLNAAGLVTEVGGRMTHGAVVAREYGLPAVVSVRDATTRIQTGQRIRVDGSRGTVKLLG